MKSFATVSAYIAHYPKKVQTLLKMMRATIKKAAPKAKEKISYGIPTFYLNGNLVHFGAFKTHISFFPGGNVRNQFKELAKYRGGKGTIQFSLDKKLPTGLITKLIKVRLKEDALRAKKLK